MPKINSPHTYCFAQQQDSSCQLMPFINMEHLSKLREGNNLPLNLHRDGTWHTKREWLPETFLQTRTWHQAIARLEDTAFGKLQVEVMKNGVKMGRFYDAQGNCLVQTGNFLRDYARLLLIPFNFTDVDMLPADLRDDTSATNSTAVVSAKSKESGFFSGVKSIATKSYDTITSSLESAAEMATVMSSMVVPKRATNEEAKDQAGNMQDFYSQWPVKSSHGNIYRFYNLTPSQKKLLDLPKSTMLCNYSYSVLGFDAIYRHRYLPKIAEKHGYYQSGLLQQLLFAMGIDNHIESSFKLNENQLTF